jgi:hypothetical protein
MPPSISSTRYKLTEIREYQTKPSINNSGRTFLLLAIALLCSNEKRKMNEVWYGTHIRHNACLALPCLLACPPLNKKRGNTRKYKMKKRWDKKKQK